MTHWPASATPAAAAHLRSIRDAMVRLFGIDGDEAEGRIDERMASIDLQDVRTHLFLGHESPETWANDIYFGADSAWWTKDPATLSPRPWPREAR